MARLDCLHDVQGLLTSGYARQPHSAYLFFSIASGRGDEAREALAALVPDLRHGVHDDWHNVRVNLAFAFDALVALGLSEDDANAFPREYRLGMAERWRLLDDDPKAWEFGDATRYASLDVLVLVFAPSDTEIEAFVARVKRSLQGPLELAHEDRAHRARDSAEHFGFRDGTSNPAILGIDPPPEGPQGLVKTGEFLLGHPNEYDRLPMSPTVAASDDPHDWLEPLATEPGRRDLGRNGTFLVYRKLRQDVRGFRDYVAAAAAELASDRANGEEWLAARMVGRWKNGAPTQLAPNHDVVPGAKEPHTNNFVFGPYPDRRDGTSCPFGSHVRRANPRDSLYPDADESLKMVARHRILRRGRPYGPRAPDPIPEDDHGDRGLVFICLNANIERQFEFIQQTWINSTKFDGLYDETDPMVGTRRKDEDGMSIQRTRGRARLRAIPEFVKMLGGGYFFLPSISAVKFLLRVRP